VLSTFAHEAAGATGTRRFLRPLLSEGMVMQNSDALRRENAELFLAVIASGAKQSISPHKERMDCFAALAMTNSALFEIQI
jgi:hypothetical protein